MTMPAQSPSEDELIGVTISGRYRIISQLGAGGMGVAYRAWDEHDGVPVVIKIPKKAFLEDPQFAERFYREIRLLQGLNHPHIVPIHDVGKHEEVPFVVLQFLPGGSLSNRRLRDDDGKPRPNSASTLHLWLPAVADALDFVHSQGVVHRDVKPANIFFDAFWGAYLGDFGIAKVVEESGTFDKEHTLTATHMGLGTPEYMAPEQFTPKAAVDGRADQYALAVMVYEMLAGVRPFSGGTSNLILEVLTHPVPAIASRRRDLPKILCDAVYKGLAKNPAERFTTCREFAAAVLRDVAPMEDEPGVARLLCPQCANILKLPTAAAGQKGKCPRCQSSMKVAEDLGALWLLDEARKQKSSAGDVGLGGVGGAPESIATAASPTEEDIAAFKPVSSTTPIGKAPRNRKKPSPQLIAVGVVAAVLLAGLSWLATSGTGGRKPPSGAVTRTYESQLASALEKLKDKPSDPAASDFVGRHWCFKEKNWGKGLPYLAKSDAFGLAALAEQERSLDQSKLENAGDFVRIAEKWWRLAGTNDIGTREVVAAIQDHAADLYQRYVGSLRTEGDIAMANRWLDRDQAFQKVVGNKRPVPMPDPPSAILDKTLVAWVRLHNLTQRGGSALTIESIRDDFDGVVFGEKSLGRWLAGSDYSRRSPPEGDAVALEQEANSRPVCMAIAYKGNQVSVYRDGKVYGEHTIEAPFQFERKDSRIIFGLGHTAAGDHACLAADIDDARIYDCALNAAEIAVLRPNVISGTRPIAWWNFNEGSVRDVFNSFQRVTVKNCSVRDGQLVLNGRNSYVVCVPETTAADKPSAKSDTEPSTPQWHNANGQWPADAIVSAETGHAYKVFKDSLPWADAKTRCEQLGGHLVTISSSNEQAFVVNCISKFGIQVDRRDGQPTAWEDKLWAGGTDQGPEGQWRWIDGTPWTFSAWVLNQPDGDGNFLNLCPHIAGEWNDEGIAGGAMPQRMAGFICEWEAKDKSEKKEIRGFRIVPANMPDQCVAALANGVRLVGISQSDDAALFKIVPGLADPQGVSFECLARPGHFLRHSGFRFHLHAFVNEDLFRRDATFYVQKLTPEAKTVTLQSQNYPSHFMRHRNGELWIDKGNDDSYLQQTAFKLAPLHKEANESQPDPRTLSQFQGSIGKTLSFNVVGSVTGGGVWGSNPYTADSQLSRAAVHAGVLKPGESGVVRVTIFPGQQSYEGTAKNGIITSSYGAWQLSYRIDGADDKKLLPAGPQPDPRTLSQFQGSIGKTLSFNVVGSVTGGGVWGSNPYTADSQLSRAAVHTGVLKPGESGVVRVTILPGRQSYEGTAKNGVTTGRWGSYGLSYRIERRDRP